MRTQLIISEAVAEQVLSYAGPKRIGFYTALNRLLILGLGFEELFGENDPHPAQKHVFVRQTDRSWVCNWCELASKHTKA